MTRAADVDGAWVASRRAQRMSWAAIARMAGCSETDLRRLNDTKAATDADWLRRAPPARDVVEKTLRRMGWTTEEAAMLGRLWAANGAPISRESLSVGVGPLAVTNQVAREVRRQAAALGVRVQIGPRALSLTPEAIVRLSELAGLRGRP